MSESESEELYRGMLSKCGGKVKTWNKRAMSLKNDFCLYYYKDINKRHQGLISLRDPKFSVRKGERGDCSWPKVVDTNNTLVVVTTPRIYYMFADTAEEAKEWREQLAMAHMRMIEGLTSHKKAKASTAPSGASGAASDPKQRFQKKKNAKVTQKFKTTEENSDHDGEGNIELDEEDDDVTARSSSISTNGDTKSNSVSSRSASQSGAPKHYRKKDRQMPTPRFQQEEEEEGDDELLMGMSMDDLREPGTLTKSSTEAAPDMSYEDFTIVGKAERYEEVPIPPPSSSAKNEHSAKAVSSPAPATLLIYDEIPGVKEVLYEDVELKATPSLRTTAHPSPKQPHKDTHVPTIPVEESLYNKTGTVAPPPDSLYDLIGYDAEQEAPPSRPDKPAPTGTSRHPEEVLYDVIKTGSPEPGFADLSLSVADLTSETTAASDTALYDDVVRPTTTNISVLKTGPPPPLPQRNPPVEAKDAPPLPVRESLKPVLRLPSPKLTKDDKTIPLGTDTEVSRDCVSSTSFGAPLVSSAPNSAPLVSPLPTGDSPALIGAPLVSPVPEALHVSPVSSPLVSPKLTPQVPPRSPKTQAAVTCAAGPGTDGQANDIISQQHSPVLVQRSPFQLEPLESAPDNHVGTRQVDCKKLEPSVENTQPDVSPSTQVTQDGFSASKHKEECHRSPEMAKVPTQVDQEEQLSPKEPSPEGTRPPSGGTREPSSEHSNLQSTESSTQKLVNLFQRQQRRFAERDITLTAEREINIQALQTVLSDTSLTPEKKAAFGELLREIEQQKQVASEEKYKWEREKIKFEIERQKFEEEKRRFQEEMELLRANAQK